MIHEPALAMRTAMFTGRLAQTVHAYPTWSIAIQQAAAQFFREFGGRRVRHVKNQQSCLPPKRPLLNTVSPCSTTSIFVDVWSRTKVKAGK
jgi:hypothetical protein